MKLLMSTSLQAYHTEVMLEKIGSVEASGGVSGGEGVRLKIELLLDRRQEELRRQEE